MKDMEAVVAAIRASGNFQSELRYIERGQYQLGDVRLFKYLENDLVRVVFPTNVAEINEGDVIAITCLYDLANDYNIYAHTICAGPGVNVLFRATDNQMPQALPQPVPAGPAAVRKFVAWKEASWVKFLNDELELGTAEASALWIASFWKALDRLFGGGCLLNYDPDAVIRERAYL